MNRDYYSTIREDNKKRYGEDFKRICQFLAETIYSNKSHFIYELQQNAEDALARRFKKGIKKEIPCKVIFQLNKNCLIFRHFGDPFNEKDVRAITDILKGTKGDDKEQIGKFGIGFKSVYTITATPEIHSADKHFVIKDYIMPYPVKPYE
jgi:HSP90 family molecular chaperone